MSWNLSLSSLGKRKSGFRILSDGAWLWVKLEETRAGTQECGRAPLGLQFEFGLEVVDCSRGLHLRIFTRKRRIRHEYQNHAL